MAQSRIPLMEVDEAKIRLVMDNSIDVLMANTEVAQRAALGPNPFERPAPMAQHGFSALIEARRARSRARSCLIRA